MNRIFRRRPSPAMIVATTALFLSMGGVSYAVAKNSIDSRAIKDGAVTGVDVRNNTLTGTDIRESKLGAVPDANRLGGRNASDYVTTAQFVRFRVEMNFGEEKTIARSGPVSLVAQCRENIDPDGSGPATAGNQDEVRMLAATTQPGAFMQGDTPHGGPGAQASQPTFDATTAAENRVLGGLVSIPSGADQPAAEDDIDTGFVMGPEGSYIGVDETTAYTLRVGGSACSVLGVATVIPR